MQEPGSLQPGRLDLHRLGAGRHRQRRALVVQHAPAGTGPARGRPVLRADRVRPRPARPAADPDLPAGERGLAGRRPAAVRPAGRAAGHAGRHRGAGRVLRSTSCCRAPARPCSWSRGREPGPHAGRRRRSAGAGRCCWSGRRSAPRRRRCGPGARPSWPSTSRCSAGTCPGTARRPRRPSPFTVAELAEGVLALAGDRPFFCAGDSIGGAVALQLLLDHRVAGAAPALHRREDRHPGELAGAGRAGPRRGHQGGRGDGGADLVRAWVRRPGAGRRRGAARPPGRHRRRLVRVGLRGARRLRRDRPAG